MAFWCVVKAGIFILLWTVILNSVETRDNTDRNDDVDHVFIRRLEGVHFPPINKDAGGNVTRQKRNSRPGRRNVGGNNTWGQAANISKCLNVSGLCLPSLPNVSTNGNFSANSSAANATFPKLKAGLLSSDVDNATMINETTKNHTTARGFMTTGSVTNSNFRGPNTTSDASNSTTPSATNAENWTSGFPNTTSNSDKSTTPSTPNAVNSSSGSPNTTPNAGNGTMPSAQNDANSTSASLNTTSNAGNGTMPSAQNDANSTFASLNTTSHAGNGTMPSAQNDANSTSASLNTTSNAGNGTMPSAQNDANSTFASLNTTSNAGNGTMPSAQNDANSTFASLNTTSNEGNGTMPSAQNDANSTSASPNTTLSANSTTQEFTFQTPKDGKAVWPSGNYSLPVPGDWCPETDDSNKTSFNLSAVFIPENATICSTNRSSGVEAHGLTGWGPGHYCLYAINESANCPLSLEKGIITFVKRSGIIFKLTFCCMDREDSSPLTLPTKDPFYLLPTDNSTNCTQVHNMTSTRQTEIRKVSAMGVHASGTFPYYLWSGINRTITFDYCRYQQVANKSNSTSSTEPPVTTDETGSTGSTGSSTAATPNGTQPANNGTNEGPRSDDTSEIGKIVGSVVGSVALICVGVAIVIIRRRRTKKQEAPRISVIDTSQPPENMDLQDLPEKNATPLELGKVLKLILDPETQLTIFKLLIHPDTLEMYDKIGKGAFGTVYYGRYRPDKNPLHAQEVAIKTLKDNCCYADINGFMNEALVMADFHHPNVLGLTGVCIQKETEIPTIVLPYMAHGDLQSYLRQFRYDKEKADKVPDFPQLLSCCLHIARGMDYLAGMKFVHRDLAARNCMLDANMVTKVADFGLTRDIYCSSYYRQDRNKLLPIKWMALESLQDRVFTTNSDIWSFGVTMWEILSLGKTPYPDQENYQILGFLENGGRMPNPKICSDGLYDLMLRCWDANPKSRPRFEDIAKHLEDVLTSMCDYLDLSASSGCQPPTTSKPPLQLTYSVTSEFSGSSADPMIPRSVYDDYRESAKK